MMEGQRPAAPDSTPGHYDAQYRAFLEVVADLRPRLHRYCARMTGSVVDGEDMAQEALFAAYRSLDRYDESRPLTTWLLAIAHNRCLDFLRRRRTRLAVETEAARQTGYAAAPRPEIEDVPVALERLVLTLPPKARACVLLADVLDFPLADTAAVLGTTVGAVKAALARGRRQLEGTRPVDRTRRVVPAEATAVLARYAACFSRRDWEGVIALTRADARVDVVDRFSGPLGASPYLERYRKATGWRLAPAWVDGDLVLVRSVERAGAWHPESVVRVWVDRGRVVRIRDYSHCRWVLGAAADVEPIAGPDNLREETP